MFCSNSAATASILFMWFGLVTLKWPRISAPAFFLGVVTGAGYFTDMLY